MVTCSPEKYDPFTGTRRKTVEYRIYDAAGTIAYIGETSSLARRMREHMRSGKLQPGCTLEFQLADERPSSAGQGEGQRH